MSYNNILSSLSEIFNNSFVLKKYNVAILSEEPKAIRSTESTAASICEPEQSVAILSEEPKAIRPTESTAASLREPEQRVAIPYYILSINISSAPMPSKIVRTLSASELM